VKVKNPKVPAVTRKAEEDWVEAVILVDKAIGYLRKRFGRKAESSTQDSMNALFLSGAATSIMQTHGSRRRHKASPFVATYFTMLSKCS
jgi:hypothetical protein